MILALTVSLIVVGVLGVVGTATYLIDRSVQRRERRADAARPDESHQLKGF